MPPEEQKCSLYPACGSGKQMEQISTLMDAIAIEYGELSAATKYQNTKLEDVTKNQIDQKELWEKYLKEGTEIARLSTALESFKEFVAKSQEQAEKAHDLLFKSIRDINEKKVSHFNLKIYATIIVTVSGMVGGGMAWIISMLLRPMK